MPKRKSDLRCACCRPPHNLHIAAPLETAIEVIRRATSVRAFVKLDKYDRVLFKVAKSEAIRTLEWERSRNPKIGLMIVPDGAVCLGATVT